MSRALPWILVVLVVGLWTVRELSQSPSSPPTEISDAQTIAPDGDSRPLGPTDPLPLSPPADLAPDPLTLRDQPVEVVVEEPVIRDTEISDHNETDDNEEWEESKGEADRISDRPYDASQTNDAIGLGGGAGGAFGGRRSGRRNPRAFPTTIPASSPTHATKVLGRGAEGSYANRYDNRFCDASATPLSTFSIDVDTASYANVRRFLTAGQLPPPDAVRIEELLNWFDYEYPASGADAAFSHDVEITSCPWRPEHHLLRIGLQGRKPPADSRRPSNLVFLLDVSGSMGDADKLPLLRQCMRMLTQQLTEDDRVAIVTYSAKARVALDSTRGSDKKLINGALDTLRASGSTNGEGGIHLAYQIAQKHFIKDGVNRVLLATDGDFNVGVQDTGALKKLIAEKTKTGVFLSCLGFGTGNYQDDKMEALADHGNGHYAYIDSAREGWKVLQRQLRANLEAIARDVKIQIEFNPAHVRSYRLIGYENRRLAAKDFNDDKKDAGDIGAGHTVTALYELVPAQPVPGAGVDSLRYQVRPELRKAARSSELLTLKIRYKNPRVPATTEKGADASARLEVHIPHRIRPLANASRDTRFAAAVALFGMILRGSPEAGRGDLAAVADLAGAAVGTDPQGQRAGFLDLVRRAEALVRSN